MIKERQKKLKEVRKKNYNESGMISEDIRILQRNLIYIIGLPYLLADPKKLKGWEFLGQYGEILKIVININKPFKRGIYEEPTYSAYITFQNELDANLAILSLDGFIYKESLINVSFGMTKYCTSFLYNKTCLVKDCVFQHEIAPQHLCFNKYDHLKIRKNLKIDKNELIQIILTNCPDLLIFKQKIEESSQKTFFPNIKKSCQALLNCNAQNQKKQIKMAVKIPKKKIKLNLKLNSIKKWDDKKCTGLNQPRKVSFQDSNRDTTYSGSNSDHEIKMEDSKLSDEESVDKRVEKTYSVPETPTKNLLDDVMRKLCEIEEIWKISNPQTKIDYILKINDLLLSSDDKILLSTIKNKFEFLNKKQSRYSFVSKLLDNPDKTTTSINNLINAFDCFNKEQTQEKPSQFNL